MDSRMSGKMSGLIQAMVKLRLKRKEFVGDDPGTFYRNQRLFAMMCDGDITEKNIAEKMTKRSMSEGEIPMEYYYSEYTSDVQEVIVEKQSNNLMLASYSKYQRGKMTKVRMKLLLHRILLQRLDRYKHPEKYMNNKILCIVGQSGAGKTLASLHLQNKLGANVICSFTTRPPRATEIEGREHHFINIVPDFNEMLAYAVFGGYEYYALKTQVHGECTVYVIDEQGLQNLREEHGDEYRIFAVYIRRSLDNRRKSGIKNMRIKRDLNRMELPERSYDWIIDNNGTKKELFINIDRIYNEVKNK